LISAPIEGREILRAKMIGTFLGLKTLIGAIAITLLFGFVMGVISLAGVLISLVQIVIFMAFIVILGTLISLRAKTTMRAIGTTLGILLALSILGPMILSAFNFHRGYYMFTWITCMPFHVAGGMIPDWEIPQIFNELGRESYSQIGRSAPVIIVGTLMFGAASLALHSLSKTVCDRLLDRPRRSVGLVKNAGPAATCSSESQASQAE
jgi:ABC-type transport system involved in multi-copper enzyme maturation permease subunit